MKFHIEVDNEACKGCYLCVETCPKKVIDIGDEFNRKGYQYVVAARNEDCIGCRQCATVCPDVVITVFKEDE